MCSAAPHSSAARKIARPWLDRTVPWRRCTGILKFAQAGLCLEPVVLGFDQLLDGFAHLFLIHTSSFSSSDEPSPPGPSYALLRLYRSGVGLSLLSRGYTPVGKSVQPVQGKAGTWVRFNVSAPQQLLEQGIELALFGLQAYAARRSPHR